jgi:hypothetical protein
MFKILISSTCNDFKEERRNIAGSLRSFGYDVVLSEEDDILFDPSIHTHSNCVEAVKAFDLVIFLVGKRFGGKVVTGALEENGLKKLENSNVDFFKSNKNISVTQAEILTALRHNIPIYTFIRNNVYNNHELYEKNKKNGFSESFNFPEFRNLEEAKYIFEFYNFIRKERVGNFCKPFEYSDEIVTIMKKQLSMLFSKLIRERRSEVLDLEDKLEILPAAIVGHRDRKREKIFERLFLNVNDGDTIRIMGTGVTNFLKDEDRIYSLLKDGNNIEILLINNKIVKSNWSCTSDEFVARLATSVPGIQIQDSIPKELKVFCPLPDLNFLIDTKHFNKYHSREDYNKNIESSVELIRKHQSKYGSEKNFGKIEAKHFKSFVPLSITSIHQEFTSKKQLIAEFILPFTTNRIIFHSDNDENPRVFELFMEFFTSTWLLASPI